MENIRSSQLDKASQATERRVASSTTVRAARSCRAKFLRYYPRGFVDADYLELERGYKWAVHERWKAELSRKTLESLIKNGKHREIAVRSVAIESRTNLLFSFEKMALRDAVKSASGARAFAEGLHAFLYGRASMEARFNNWIRVVGSLPRRQTRVLTWPVLTVMGFFGSPLFICT